MVGQAEDGARGAVGAAARAGAAQGGGGRADGGVRGALGADRPEDHRGRQRQDPRHDVQAAAGPAAGQEAVRRGGGRTRVAPAEGGRAGAGGVSGPHR
ncbi:hypothetical protein SGPA1_30912 [Streptomyces misionensis JCM 4497]